MLTQAIYVRVATSSEPFTTVWRVGSATGVAAGVAAYRGVDDNRPVQTSGGTVSRNSAFIRTPSVFHGAGTLVAGFFGRNEAGGVADAARDDPPLPRVDPAGIRARRRRRPRPRPG